MAKGERVVGGKRGEEGGWQKRRGGWEAKGEKKVACKRGEGAGWQKTYMQTATSNSNENEVGYRLQEPKK